MILGITLLIANQPKTIKIRINGVSVMMIVLDILRRKQYNVFCEETGSSGIHNKKSLHDGRPWDNKIANAAKKQLKHDRIEGA